MSPKKKTKLHRGRKSRANKANVKKNTKRASELVALLNKLDQEDQTE